MKIALINDTYNGGVTGGSHFGCQLVMETYEEHLTGRNHQIVQRIGANERWYDVGISKEVDLVIVNGEGSLHHNRRNDLLSVAKEAPAILINTVFEANTTEGLEHFKYIACRESWSKAAMDDASVEVVPDLLFGNKWLRQWDNFGKKPNVPLRWGETDSVLRQGQFGKSAITDKQDFMEWLTALDAVVCGRFHAVAAAAVAGVPFVAYPSNTWKVQGMLDDMGQLDRLFKDREECHKKVSYDWDTDIDFYCGAASAKIHTMFDRLEEWV